MFIIDFLENVTVLDDSGDVYLVYYEEGVKNMYMYMTSGA